MHSFRNILIFISSVRFICVEYSHIPIIYSSIPLPFTSTVRFPDFTSSNAPRLYPFISSPPHPVINTPTPQSVLPQRYIFLRIVTQQFPKVFLWKMAGIVVVFDFDKTIIDLDSDNWVVDELGATDLFNQLLPTMPWNSLMVYFDIFSSFSFCYFR